MKNRRQYNFLSCFIYNAINGRLILKIVSSIQYTILSDYRVCETGLMNNIAMRINFEIRKIIE